MIQIAAIWLSIKTDRRGVTALEYGLLAGVIVAVIALGFTNLADALSSEFTTIGSGL
jgi:Flp pilus assembly pilin Flp